MSDASLIGGKKLAGKKPTAEEAPADEGDDFEVSGAYARKAAAKELLKAIEASDASAIDRALAAHWKACSAEPSEDVEE